MKNKGLKIQTQAVTKAFTKYMNWASDSRPQQSINTSSASNIEPKDNSEYNFFRRVYTRRMGEEFDFSTFLDGNARVLVLTGHVGIGKSTFLRFQMEHKRSCTGLLIDCFRHEHLLTKCKNFSETLRNILKEEFHERLLRNFSHYEAEKIQFGEDITFRKDIKTPKDVSDAGTIMLMSYILAHNDHLRSDELDALRAIYGQDVPPIKPEKKISYFKKNLKNHKGNFLQATRSIYQACTCFDLANLYRLLFPSPLPYCIILDNTDIIDMRRINPGILQEISLLENHLNAWSPTALNLNQAFPDYNFIFAIRDENTGALTLEGVDYSKIQQIAIRMQTFDAPQVIPNVNAPDSLVTDLRFVSRVVRRRLKHIKQITKDCKSVWPHLDKILSFWFGTNLILYKDSARVDILEMNNYSLRQILEYIKEVSLDLLKICLRKGLTPEMIHKQMGRYVMRGRIIRAVLNNNSSFKFRQRTENDFQKKLSGNLSLSFSRLLLTFLIPRKNEIYQCLSFTELLQELKRILPDLNEAQLRSTLHTLYQSASNQGEFISIRQDMYISEDTIMPDARICAMPRARQFVTRIYPHMDFFGELFVPAEGGLVGREKPILNELPPNKASTYCNIIFEKFQALSTHYFEQFKIRALYWQKEHGAKDSALPFMEFSKARFILFKELYPYRVAHNHSLMIKIYTREVLKGLMANLLLSEQSKSELESISKEVIESWNTEQMQIWQTYRDSPHDQLSDAEFAQLIKVNTPNKAMRKLSNIHAGYVKIRNTCLHYQNINFEQLKKMKQEGNNKE